MKSVLTFARLKAAEHPGDIMECRFNAPFTLEWRAFPVTSVVAQIPRNREHLRFLLKIEINEV
jgi:hypothetical protein